MCARGSPQPSITGSFSAGLLYLLQVASEVAGVLRWDRGEAPVRVGSPMVEVEVGGGEATGLPSMTPLQQGKSQGVSEGQSCKGSQWYQAKPLSES